MNKIDIKETPIVILAGGQGIYMDSSGLRKAKGEVDFFGHSLIDCILSKYRKFGFKNFIVSGGYRLDILKKSVLSHYLATELPEGLYQLKDKMGEISVRFIDSGLESSTGERLKAVEKYIATNEFGVAYSDSFADVNLNDVYLNFKNKNTLATLVGVRLKPRFRALGIRSGDSRVRGFSDHIFMPGHLINGGYYFFKKDVFKIPLNWKTLETEVLEKLVEMRELDSYLHDGAFCALDCERDIKIMETIISDSKIDNLSHT